MAELFAPTLDDQIASVRREISFRESFYPRWVAAGKMKPENAEREIARMKAALQTLMDLREGTLRWPCASIRATIGEI